MGVAEVPLSVIVLSEARELLSVLRRNRRFGYLLSFTAASQPIDHPLVKEVKSLRDIVRVSSAASHSTESSSPLLIPPPVLLNALDPFLEVVRSHDASGIITGVALLSLDRIISRLLSLAAPRHELSAYAPALVAVMDAAAACRFDATDPAADEVVLASITRVIAGIMTSPALPLLPDAAILRAVEACLGIAAGRRRASDLLKRVADSALVDVFRAVGRHIAVVCWSGESASSGGGGEAAAIPGVVASGVNGSVFGYSLDTDSFAQHGPASTSVIAALIELCARMTDPTISGSYAERALGMQLMAAIVGSAGSAVRRVPILKQLLVRDCSRAVLRSLGLFQSQPAIISAAFNLAIQLVYVLEEDGCVVLLALLGRVYPYYVSGYQNVLPEVAWGSELGTATSFPNGNSAGNGSSPNISNGTVEAGTIPIDPVIREIGLESLAALLSTPGLLCVAYRVADCDLRATDVVKPLLKALGYTAKTKRSRKRSKRLRASSSGSNRVSNGLTDLDSEEDDIVSAGANNGSENSRFAREASLLCAESLLAVIDTINERLETQSDGSVQRPSDGDRTLLANSRAIRRQKTQLQLAAKIFNASEKYEKAAKLLVMLKERGLAKTSTDASGTVNEDFEGDVQAVVRFLRETPGLRKERIGMILGEPDGLSRRVLSDYTATMEFKDRPFTESLRLFLESFRLPGESQKINRIVQSFANRYYEQNKPASSPEAELVATTEIHDESTQESLDSPDKAIKVQNGSNTHPSVANGAEPLRRGSHTGVLKSADAAYVLSYSVVMLNTDQHNDSIKKKMVLDDFIRNSRGINAGSDVPRWFLADIFSSIAAVEIRMSDEAGIGAMTDLLWDEQIKKLSSDGALLPKITESREFEEELFVLAWEPAVMAANSILYEAGDANSVQKALEGFLCIARSATAYRKSRPTDAVVCSLTTATTLREGPLHGAIARFGMDIKAQMASVALSGVSEQCADGMETQGWQSLVSYLLRLHALCLLPAGMEQQIGGNGAEVVGVDREELQPSKLIPGWWPSQVDRVERHRAVDEKPRKSVRTNGFFAAIIAASIGSEMDSEDEDDYDNIKASGGDGRIIRRTSHAPPHYIRTRNAEETEAQELARKCIASCRIEDFILNGAKVLQSSALGHLSKAVAKSAYRIMDAGRDNAEVNGEDGGDTSRVEDVSFLDWSEIAPPSPRGEPSIIAGVTSKYRSVDLTDSEPNFSSFGLTATWTGRVREKDEKKAKDFVIAFCIDVLCELTLQNRDRLHLPWPALHGVVVRIIAPATEPSAVLERAVVCLLRVGVRLLHRVEVRDDVLRGLNLLVRLPQDTAEVLSVTIAAGVFHIVKAHGSGIRSTSGWHAILSIIESSARYRPEAREIGLETISCLLKGQSSLEAVSPETFTPLLHAILAYTSCPSVEASIRALDLLYHLSQSIHDFALVKSLESSDDKNTAPKQEGPRADSEMWSEFWGPLFLGFASSVRDARGKVRNSALGVLERVVASGGSAESLSAQQWSRALSTVLLPLMTQLFTTRGFLEATLEAEQAAQKRLLAEKNASVLGSRGRSRVTSTSLEHQEQLRKSVVAACNRTRMRAATLTSKTFLQHHMTIASGISEDSFTELWIGVLEVFRVAVESGSGETQELGGGSVEKQDDLAEHVPESVKNMLLVMCDCGLLKAEQRVRWNATFAVTRKFVPDIEEIITAATSGPVTSKADEPEPAPESLSKTTADETAHEEAEEGNEPGGPASQPSVPAVLSL